MRGGDHRAKMGKDLCNPKIWLHFSDILDKKTEKMWLQLPLQLEACTVNESNTENLKCNLQ